MGESKGRESSFKRFKNLTQTPPPVAPSFVEKPTGELTPEQIVNPAFADKGAAAEVAQKAFMKEAETKIHALMLKAALGGPEGEKARKEIERYREVKDEAEKAKKRAFLLKQNAPQT